MIPCCSVYQAEGNSSSVHRCQLLYSVNLVVCYGGSVTSNLPLLFGTLLNLTTAWRTQVAAKATLYELHSVFSLCESIRLKFHCLVKTSKTHTQSSTRCQEVNDVINTTHFPLIRNKSFLQWLQAPSLTEITFNSTDVFFFFFLTILHRKDTFYFDFFCCHF